MTDKATSADITQRLQEAIDKLHDDVHRIEVWAGALTGFTQPVPAYEPRDDHMLPQAAADPDDASGAGAGGTVRTGS